MKKKEGVSDFTFHSSISGYPNTLVLIVFLLYNSFGTFQLIKKN